MKKIVFALIISFSMTYTLYSQNNSDLELIYVGDPMCSWCYGFAPEITTIKDSFSDIPFSIVLGGLRPYSKQIMDEELKDFLEEHWVEINQRTGQPFNYDILDLEGFIYDTEPLSRATVVAAEMKPEIEFEFFKEAQKAFYYENLNTNLESTYRILANRFNLEEDKFIELFNSEEIKKKTKAHFVRSRDLGVRGFPSLILRIDDNYKFISYGYQKASVLITEIEAELKK